MPDLKVFASHPVQYHVPFFRELVKSGIDIQVLYYHHGTAGQSAQDKEFGIELQWDIDLLSGYNHHFLLRSTPTYTIKEQLSLLRQLLTWALEHRRTPLLLIGWFTEIIWLIWLLRVIFNMPVMVLSETTPLSFEATPKPRWRNALLGWLLRHTHACLFIGSRNRAFYQSMGVQNEHLFSVPYSVDNSRFEGVFETQRTNRSAICVKHGLNPTLPTFLFCGKLITKKRPVELFDAYLAAGLRDQAQLIYVGDGIMRAELEARIKSANARNVHLLGFFNQTQMPTAYVLGEILCLLSDSTETWGLVVNEAFCCGRPAIVTNTVGCSTDLVISGETGWTIPLDDSDALTSVLRKAYQHHVEWPEMGQHARSKIADHNYTEMVMGIKSALKTMKSA